MSTPDNQSFLNAFGLRRGDVVSIVGAGGKTSLMFRLAREARNREMKVLVTTSTKILVPNSVQYDALDLTGKLFSDQTIAAPGVYVGGLPDNLPGKMQGVREDFLARQRHLFDLVLIEADGAACKPLKGWRNDEPVVDDSTTATIGVLDIQTIGTIVNETSVHRLGIFSQLTGAEPGDIISLGHLLRIICHDDGLFSRSLGREILFINKVESEEQQKNADLLRSQLDNLHIVAGSVTRGTIHG